MRTFTIMGPPHAGKSALIEALAGLEGGPAALVVGDLSFISLRLILPAIQRIGASARPLMPSPPGMSTCRGSPQITMRLFWPKLQRPAEICLSFFPILSPLISDTACEKDDPMLFAGLIHQ